MARRQRLDDMLEEFRRKDGGLRRTVQRVLGDKLGAGGSAFLKEHFEFNDDDEGPRAVDVVETPTCTFGHTIDDKVRVAGICEIGGEILCSVEGCLLQCAHCGAVVCRTHSSTYGDKTYCLNHRWVHYWRVFWRLD
jgi:hypothetical protein